MLEFIELEVGGDNISKVGKEGSLQKFFCGIVLI